MISTWRGYDKVIVYSKGKDVVLTTIDGKYITTMRDQLLNVNR